MRHRILFLSDICHRAARAGPLAVVSAPCRGLIIVGAYHLLHDEKDTGTNLVISAIHSDDELPLRMAPLIFISTLITHLFGGSAGREGAALQMGGSIGNAIGKFFRFDDKDKHVMIMCGMSAAFSALFGTPMAAAILPMEIVSVGVMYYTALCSMCDQFSCRTRSCLPVWCFQPMVFHRASPDFGILPAVQISILAVLCALVSIVFCVLLHKSEEIYRKTVPESLHPHLCRWMYCCHSDDACRQPELQRYRYRHHPDVH